jgi:hypothetical protein
MCKPYELGGGHIAVERWMPNLMSTTCKKNANKDDTWQPIRFGANAACRIVREENNIGEEEIRGSPCKRSIARRSLVD